MTKKPPSVADAIAVVCSLCVEEPVLQCVGGGKPPVTVVGEWRRDGVVFKAKCWVPSEALWKIAVDKYGADRAKLNGMLLTFVVDEGDVAESRQNDVEWFREELAARGFTVRDVDLLGGMVPPSVDVLMLLGVVSSGWGEDVL